MQEVIGARPEFRLTEPVRRIIQLGRTRGLELLKGQHVFPIDSYLNKEILLKGNAGDIRKTTRNFIGDLKHYRNNPRQREATLDEYVMGISHPSGFSNEGLYVKDAPEYRRWKGATAIHALLGAASPEMIRQERLDLAIRQVLIRCAPDQPAYELTRTVEHLLETNDVAERQRLLGLYINNPAKLMTEMSAQQTHSAA